MKFILTLLLGLTFCVQSNAQTQPKKTYQTYLWCSFGSMAVAVGSHGYYNTLLASEKEKSYLNGVGNGALFASGACLIAALGEYSKYRQKENGLTFRPNPVGFSLAYRF